MKSQPRQSWNQLCTILTRAAHRGRRHVDHLGVRSPQCEKLLFRTTTPREKSSRSPTFEWVCLAVNVSPRKMMFRERSATMPAFPPSGRTTRLRTATACVPRSSSVWTRVPCEPTMSSALLDRGPTTSGPL